MSIGAKARSNEKKRTKDKIWIDRHHGRVIERGQKKLKDEKTQPRKQLNTDSKKKEKRDERTKKA